jgi:DNA-directed RNA polymerase
VQPYKSQSQKNIISTVIQSLSVAESLDDQPVNKQKQNTAFPPNFVHSLDSTHMMYTALDCQEQGITFAAVHDSFWAHATNISPMNRVLRKQFINLHGSPLLENLYENFTSRYPKEKFPAIPKRGEFDLNEIEKSTYFFS